MAGPLTRDRLLEVLSYDPDTGLFTWRRKRRPLGERAGSPCLKWGYTKICVDKRMYLAHRLAWLWVYGDPLPAQIDHINAVPNDNRIANLRACSGSQNSGNRRISTRNTTGYKGVQWIAREKRFAAKLRKNGKQYHLGFFNDPKEAHEAYMKAARQHFSEFARQS